MLDLDVEKKIETLLKQRGRGGWVGKKVYFTAVDYIFQISSRN